jgi:hypothetical protein
MLADIPQVPTARRVRGRLNYNLMTRLHLKPGAEASDEIASRVPEYDMQAAAARKLGWRMWQLAVLREQASKRLVSAGAWVDIKRHQPADFVKSQADVASRILLAPGDI